VDIKKMKFLIILLSLYKKTTDKILKLPFILFVLVVLVLSFIITLPFAFYDDGVVHPINEKHIIYRIVVACILAPVLETLLHQTLPIYIFTKKWIRKRNIAIFLSALSFGLLHFYSVLYILITFMIGLVFSWAYLIYYERHSFEKAFWAITLVHALRNAIAVLVGVFFPESI
jgi:hypothetical protein